MKTLSREKMRALGFQFACGLYLREEIVAGVMCLCIARALATMKCA
jgi:hypothetical protein